MSTRIIFNGKTYTDPSEMPADVRKAYDQALGLLADANRNGIPDLLETAGLGNVISVQQSQIVVNGQSYGGPEEMPPFVRQLYDLALRQLGPAGSDLPQAREDVTGPDVSSGQPVMKDRLQSRYEAGYGPFPVRLLPLVGAAILGFIVMAIWLMLGM